MTWSAPSPYEGFETAAEAAPREEATRGGPPPSSAVAAPSPYTAPVPVPAAVPRARHRGVHRAGALVITALVTVGAVVAAVIVGLLGAAVDDSDDPPFGGSGHPELDAAWTVDSYDLANGYGSFGTPEGTITDPLLTTSTGWVTMVQPSTPDALLVSVDPDTGAVRWTAGMPEGRCTQTERGVDLVCLTRSDGSSTFQLVTVDPSSGDVVGGVDVDLPAVPALLLPLGDGLLTLSVSGVLTGFGLDGVVGWSQPIGLPDLDLSHEQADVATYPDSVLLYFGWIHDTVRITAAGEVTTRPCHSAAATPQAWVCEGESLTIGYAPDGTELWRGDWDDYYLVVAYQHIAPTAIVDNWDGTVSPVDPITGERGPAVRVAADASHNLSLVGSDPDHPIVTTDTDVVLLDAGVTTVLWSQPVTDEFLNIAGGGVVDDQVVIDGELSYGFDLTSGDQLWSRDFLAADVWVHDGALVGYAYNELIRYQLP